MHAFTDNAYAHEITSLNTVHIGDPVYVLITSSKNLPNNVDYWLTDCTAYRDFANQAGDSFDMIDVRIIFFFECSDFFNFSKC